MAASGPAGGRGGGGIVDMVLSAAGPLSALAVSLAVMQGYLTAPTALLAVALLGAATVAARAFTEPVAGPPTWEQSLHLIRRRRSVFPRDFSGGRVERWQLEAMLEAARWAPTHKKTEPWHFVVLGGEAKVQFEALTMELCRERLPPEKAEKVLEKLERKAGKDWKSVSCYIAICVKRHPDQLPEWEEVAATSCAAQNLWLAATAVGVAGYWSSWQEPARTAHRMNEFLGIGPEDLCLGFFVAGTADAERAAAYKASRRPLESVVEWRL